MAGFILLGAPLGFGETVQGRKRVPSQAYLDLEGRNSEGGEKSEGEKRDWNLSNWLKGFF